VHGEPEVQQTPSARCRAVRRRRPAPPCRDIVCRRAHSAMFMTPQRVCKIACAAVEVAPATLASPCCRQMRFILLFLSRPRRLTPAFAVDSLRRRHHGVHCSMPIEYIATPFAQFYAQPAMPFMSPAAAAACRRYHMSRRHHARQTLIPLSASLRCSSGSRQRTAVYDAARYQLYSSGTLRRRLSMLLTPAFRTPFQRSRRTR